MGVKVLDQGRREWKNLFRGQSAKFQFLFSQSYFNQGTLFGPFQLFRIDLEEFGEILIMTDRDELVPSFAPAQKPEVVVMGPDENDSDDGHENDPGVFEESQEFIQPALGEDLLIEQTDAKKP
jgi:hypothetical protein